MIGGGKSAQLGRNTLVNPKIVRYVQIVRHGGRLRYTCPL